MNRGFATSLTRLLILSGACTAALVLLPGCKKKAAAGGPPGGGMPPTTVVAAEVKQQPIAETLALVGTLAANEFVEVKSEVDGIVSEILFNEGQAAKKGDVLIRLDDTKFRAALQQAEANLKLSQSTYERTKQLVTDQTISPQEFDQAAATLHANEAALTLRKRELQDTQIVAPFSGTVGARSISAGQVISKNTVFTWVVDLETLKAEFNLPERFLSQVRVGQPIEVRVAAFPNERFKGEVYFLAPQIDPATRTLLMKAKVPNLGQKLRPGMFANLDLTLKLRDDAVVIPESAVMSMGDRTMVYVIGSNSTAQIRPVKIGFRMPNQVEIMSGLAPGEKVVTEGVQKVRPGAPVKEAAPLASHGQPQKQM